MLTTKRFSFVHNWLVGESSTAGLPPRYASHCETHREAAKAILQYAEDGDEHRGIAVHNAAHVYRCLLRVFQIEPLPEEELFNWIGRWESWSRAGDLTSILKWWFPALYAFCTGQPLPAVPPALQTVIKGTPGKSSLCMSILPERAGHFLRSVVAKLRSKLSSNPKHTRSLGRALTLRFLAKGTSVVSEEEIAKALAKHRVSLTEVDGLRPRDPTDKGLLRRLLWQVRRTAFEIFGGKEFKLRERPMFPSRKGHQETPGLKGGAATVILNKFAATAKRQAMGVVLHPAKTADLGPLTEESQHAFASSVLAGIRQEAWGSLIYTPEGYRFSKSMLATPVAVTEPCKVRIVTKGPECVYYYLKGLQKFLWGTLKVHPCFELIGQPISEELLAKRFGDLPLGTTFVSGDYKGATDNLRARLSRAACRAISSALALSELDTLLFEKALVGHTLCYKGVDSDGNKTVTRCSQTNGQLMGSPVSFPILCVVNAAICRYAMETDATFNGDPSEDNWESYEGSLLSLTRARLLVNGDDCVFAIGEEFRFCLWEKIAARAGMESSVGKTYVSSDFIQMNSTTYVVSQLPEVGTWFTEVPYINFGFCSPFDPKGGRERTYRDLPGLAREFLRGHPAERRDAMMGWFLRDHAQVLKTIPSGMSYWLPSHLGGLGLPITRKLDSTCFSEFQLNFAEFLLHHSEEPTTFPSEERSVPLWVRSGERTAAKMRRREKVGLDQDPWEIKAVPEDEQYVYWHKAPLASHRKKAIVPASRGSFEKLRKKFIKSGVRAHSPLATLLGDPSPHMRMAPGLCDLTESEGLHPTDLGGRIASIVNGDVYRPREKALGRVVVQNGVIFELFENHFCVRLDPLGLEEVNSSRLDGLRCLLRNENQEMTTDTTILVRGISCLATAE